MNIHSSGVHLEGEYQRSIQQDSRHEEVVQKAEQTSEHVADQ